jgi:hypothetical protein
VADPGRIPKEDVKHGYVRPRRCDYENLKIVSWAGKREIVPAHSDAVEGAPTAGRGRRTGSVRIGCPAELADGTAFI